MDHSPPAHDAGRVSAVSIPLVLEETEELLIRAQYLQSSSQRAEKKTRWLLNTAIPYTSLLAGLYQLICVRSPRGDPLVISATTDPLIEVAIVELKEGQAFAFQPRALAGVVQLRDRPLRITGHWRLFSLQAWLTFQLRFLVFHGPAKLIVKGCRGVRMEQAGSGRLINQSATLGFDASLLYANTRCETFVSYWAGHDNLFNDLFSDGSGFYVYEEMPNHKQKSGITGRGAGGLFDATLKAFGV